MRSRVSRTSSGTSVSAMLRGPSLKQAAWQGRVKPELKLLPHRQRDAGESLGDVVPHRGDAPVVLVGVVDLPLAPRVLHAGAIDEAKGAGREGGGVVAVRRAALAEAPMAVHPLAEPEDLVLAAVVEAGAVRQPRHRRQPGRRAAGEAVIAIGRSQHRLVEPQPGALAAVAPGGEGALQ